MNPRDAARAAREKALADPWTFTANLRAALARKHRCSAITARARKFGLTVTWATENGTGGVTLRCGSASEHLGLHCLDRVEAMVEAAIADLAAGARKGSES